MRAKVSFPSLLLGARNPPPRAHLIKPPPHSPKPIILHSGHHSPLLPLAPQLPLGTLDLPHLGPSKIGRLLRMHSGGLMRRVHVGAEREGFGLLLLLLEYRSRGSRRRGGSDGGRGNGGERLGLLLLFHYHGGSSSRSRSGRSGRLHYSSHRRERRRCGWRQVSHELSEREEQERRARHSEALPSRRRRPCEGVQRIQDRGELPTGYTRLSESIAEPHGEE